MGAPGVPAAIDPRLSPRPDRAIGSGCPAGASAGVDAIVVAHAHIARLDLPALRRVAKAPGDGPDVLRSELPVPDGAAAGPAAATERGRSALPHEPLFAARACDP